MKMRIIKRIIDQIQIYLGIIGLIIIYLGKYKKVRNLDFPFIFCTLLYGLVHFLDNYKFSEKYEMTSYHLFGSICLLIVGVLAFFFKIAYNKSIL